MPELKTSIKELTLCNDRITAETAKQCKVPEGKVTEFMSIIGAYIADVIRTGAMEGVMLPHFGKIRANKKTLRAVKNKERNEPNGKDMIWRAMNGRTPVDFRTKTDTDDTKSD